MTDIEPKLLTAEDLAAISKATAYDPVAFANERLLLDHIIVLSKQLNELQTALDSVVAHIAALEQQQDKLRAALAWAIALIHDWWLAQGDVRETP